MSVEEALAGLGMLQNAFEHGNARTFEAKKMKKEQDFLAEQNRLQRESSERNVKVSSGPAYIHAGIAKKNQDLGIEAGAKGSETYDEATTVAGGMSSDKGSWKGGKLVPSGQTAAAKFVSSQIASGLLSPSQTISQGLETLTPEKQLAMMLEHQQTLGGDSAEHTFMTSAINKSLEAMKNAKMQEANIQTQIERMKHVGETVNYDVDLTKFGEAFHSVAQKLDSKWDPATPYHPYATGEMGDQWQIGEDKMQQAVKDTIMTTYANEPLIHDPLAVNTLTAQIMRKIDTQGLKGLLKVDSERPVSTPFGNRVLGFGKEYLTGKGAGGNDLASMLGLNESEYTSAKSYQEQKLSARYGSMSVPIDKYIYLKGFESRDVGTNPSTPVANKLFQPVQVTPSTTPGQAAEKMTAQPQGQ